MSCNEQAYIVDGDTSPILVTLERDGTPFVISSGATVTARLRREDWVNESKQIVYSGDSVSCSNASPANWPNGVVAISFTSSVAEGVWDLLVQITQSGATESYLLESAVRVHPS